MCRQDMGHLTAWATDSRQILWRRDGGNRRSTAPRVHARSLPENMAFRSDILSEARQNSAGDYEHTARAMSRHVMWHQLRAMREENRATLSGGPRRFIRQTTPLRLLRRTGTPIGIPLSGAGDGSIGRVGRPVSLYFQKQHRLGGCTT